MHRGQHALWISLLCLSACSPKVTTYASVASVHVPAPERPPAATVPVLKVSGPQLAALRMMALGDAADPQAAEDWGRKIESGAATVSDYVDHLLSQPQFASSIAPAVILRSMLVESEELDATGSVLQTSEVGGRPLYFLRKVCRANEAIPVKPWWSPSETVWVCPDSYRPDRIYDPALSSYCGTSTKTVPNESSYCGCGPSLIFCYKDDEQLADMLSSLLQEVIRTTDYIVAQDLPIQTLFSSNETFRDRNAELWRLREMLVAGQPLPDLQGWSWPAAGKWSGRAELKPGQHAGILTTPHMSYYMDEDPRPRMKTYFNIMWCKEPESLNVDAQDIFKLGARNLRAGEGWQQLARMPICTNCHARMDHAMMFFSGYPNIQISTAFVPSLQRSGEGFLYGNNIKDLRGQTELNPRAFAQLAVAQPEFEGCMVRDIIEHVFNDEATDADYQALRAEFRQGSSFKRMMRTALLRLVARGSASKEVAEPAAPESPPIPAAAASADDIVMPAPLQVMLDSRCSDCHSSGTRQFEIADHLPRQMAQRVLSQVAFGGMPKGRPLPRAEREGMVRTLIQVLWTDAPSREQALHYYNVRPHSVQRLISVLRVIATNAQASGYQTSLSSSVLSESLIRQDVARYTPGLAATVALEALRACRHTHTKDPVALRRCVEEATRPEAMLKHR